MQNLRGFARAMRADTSREAHVLTPRMPSVVEPVITTSLALSNRRNRAQSHFPGGTEYSPLMMVLEDSRNGSITDTGPDGASFGETF